MVLGNIVMSINFNTTRANKRTPIKMMHIDEFYERIHDSVLFKLSGGQLGKSSSSDLKQQPSSPYNGYYTTDYNLVNTNGLTDTIIIYQPSEVTNPDFAYYILRTATTASTTAPDIDVRGDSVSNEDVLGRNYFKWTSSPTPNSSRASEVLQLGQTTSGPFPLDLDDGSQYQVSTVVSQNYDRGRTETSISTFKATTVQAGTTAYQGVIYGGLMNTTPAPSQLTKANFGGSNQIKKGAFINTIISDRVSTVMQGNNSIEYFSGQAVNPPSQIVTQSVSTSVSSGELDTTNGGVTIVDYNQLNLFYYTGVCDILVNITIIPNTSLSGTSEVIFTLYADYAYSSESYEGLVLQTTTVSSSTIFFDSDAANVNYYLQLGGNQPNITPARTTTNSPVPTFFLGFRLAAKNLDNVTRSDIKIESQVRSYNQSYPDSQKACWLVIDNYIGPLIFDRIVNFRVIPNASQASLLNNSLQPPEPLNVNDTVNYILQRLVGQCLGVLANGEDFYRFMKNIEDSDSFNKLMCYALCSSVGLEHITNCQKLQNNHLSDEELEQFTFHSSGLRDFFRGAKRAFRKGTKMIGREVSKQVGNTMGSLSKSMRTAMANLNTQQSEIPVGELIQKAPYMASSDPRYELFKDYSPYPSKKEYFASGRVSYNCSGLTKKRRQNTSKWITVKKTLQLTDLINQHNKQTAHELEINSDYIKVGYYFSGFAVFKHNKTNAYLVLIPESVDIFTNGVITNRVKFPTIDEVECYYSYDPLTADPVTFDSYVFCYPIVPLNKILSYCNIENKQFHTIVNVIKNVHTWTNFATPIEIVRDYLSSTEDMTLKDLIETEHSFHCRLSEFSIHSTHCNYCLTNFDNLGEDNWIFSKTEFEKMLKARDPNDYPQKGKDYLHINVHEDDLLDTSRLMVFINPEKKYSCSRDPSVSIGKLTKINLYKKDEHEKLNLFVQQNPELKEAIRVSNTMKSHPLDECDPRQRGLMQRFADVHNVNYNVKKKCSEMGDYTSIHDLMMDDDDFDPPKTSKNKISELVNNMNSQRRELNDSYYVRKNEKKDIELDQALINANERKLYLARMAQAVSPTLDTGILDIDHSFAKRQGWDKNLVSLCTKRISGSYKDIPLTGSAAKFVAIESLGNEQYEASIFSIVITKRPYVRLLAALNPLAEYHSKPVTKSDGQGTLHLVIDHVFDMDEEGDTRTPSDVFKEAVNFFYDYGLRGKYFVNVSGLKVPEPNCITGPSFALALYAAMLGLPSYPIYTGDVINGLIKPVGNINFKIAAASTAQVPLITAPELYDQLDGAASFSDIDDEFCRLAKRAAVINRDNYLNLRCDKITTGPLILHTVENLMSLFLNGFMNVQLNNDQLATAEMNYEKMTNYDEDVVQSGLQRQQRELKKKLSESNDVSTVSKLKQDLTNLQQQKAIMTEKKQKKRTEDKLTEDLDLQPYTEAKKENSQSKEKFAKRQGSFILSERGVSRLERLGQDKFDKEKVNSKFKIHPNNNGEKVYSHYGVFAGENKDGIWEVVRKNGAPIFVNFDPDFYKNPENFAHQTREFNLRSGRISVTNYEMTNFLPKPEALKQQEVKKKYDVKQHLYSDDDDTFDF